MVFIRRVRTASGATAVQIMAKVRGQNRVLEHVGSAHTEVELALLQQAARERLDEMSPPLDLPIELPVSSARLLSAARGPDLLGGAGERGQENAQVVGPARTLGAGSDLLYQALAGVYQQLGFHAALGDAVFADLVIARVVEPTSLLDTGRVLGELGQRPVSYATMKRALAKAAASDYRGLLAGACCRHAAARGDLTLLMYDVTTLYFEAEHEDELRKVGYSKERRVDPQIVVGLLVDRGGFPLEVTCWEGTPPQAGGTPKAETATLLPTIRAFQARHGAADFVVVADAGMLSSANLNELDAAGLRFIVGSRQTKAPGDLASHFQWNGDAFTDGQLIDTVTPRHAGAASENDIRLRAEPVWDPATHSKSWRAVWAYSTKRAVRDGKTLTVQENRARAVVAGQRRTRSPRFVTVRGDAKVLDEKALARARRLAGLKGYVTNIPATIMAAGEVVANYHDLWHVEQSFRMSKTDLRARPMFHHTRDAIEAWSVTAFVDWF